MNKMKRLSALVCAGALVMSTVPAYAAVTSTGDGAVENMGQQGIEFDRIVLPTMPEGTYDFVLDPAGLLATYGGSDYTAGKTVYFNAEATAAKLEVDTSVTGTDGKFYRDGIAEDTAFATIKAAIEVDTTDKKTITGLGGAGNTKKFYVWVPDAASTQSEGTYKEITLDNLETYCDVTIDASGAVTGVAMKTGKTESTVNDGKLYVDGKIALDFTADDKMTDYVTITDGAVTALTSNKMYTKATAGGAFTEVAAIGSVKYTPATRTYTDTSDKATIVNKSSSDKKVKVKVSVTNGDGLDFVAADTFTDKTKAGVSLAISDGTNKEYVTKKEDATTKKVTYSAVAEISVSGVDVGASSTDIIKYMGDTEDATGGHQFKAYLKPTMSYQKAEFTLVGVANSDATGTAAWDAYAESLSTSATNMRPGITVVYDILDDVTKLTSTDTVSSEISWPADGWAWFDLGVTDAPTSVQLVANEGTDDEAVYALKSSDYSQSASFIGVNPAKAGGPQKLTALIEVGAKVYKKVLW